MDRTKSGLDDFFRGNEVEPEVRAPPEPERSGNKFQYADMISNADEVLDVHVIGDEIRVVFQLLPELDLTWVGHFLEERNYEHERSEMVYAGVQKDVFVDQI